jgi:hypothetical protein
MFTIIHYRKLQPAINELLPIFKNINLLTEHKKATPILTGMALVRNRPKNNILIV